MNDHSDEPQSNFDTQSTSTIWWCVLAYYLSAAMIGFVYFALESKRMGDPGFTARIHGPSWIFFIPMMFSMTQYVVAGTSSIRHKFATALPALATMMVIAALIGVIEQLTLGHFDSVWTPLLWTFIGIVQCSALIAIRPLLQGIRNPKVST
ncbi:MAG: hypothetical protein HKN47_28955 [Pirellulaceae bacterium]|nr:hypothetical protein [Pirellulaceae bacterium]